MQSGGGTKNPPWARSNVNTNMTGINPQIMDANAMMGQQGLMPFQQSQAVFNPNMMQSQGGMSMAMSGQMPMNQMSQGQMYPGNVVAYPNPRATMNTNMYQNNQSSQGSGTRERVFTGTVTKTHNDFGFVDQDVFYQTSVCAKGIIPKLNDRVLVEATYNPNMPFKWNATCVQVLPKTAPSQKQSHPSKNSNNYTAVPPPSGKKSLPSRRDDRPLRREDRKRSRTRSRSRSRDRRDSRNRRDSPPRKRSTIHQTSPPTKYLVRVPRIPLDVRTLDVPALSQRYTNLYIPSDFFNSHVKWGETFPPDAPFSLNNPCSYHIMSKDVESPYPNDAVLEPPDADYRFSAKVMLISMPTMESLYQKCGLTKSEEKDKRSSSKSPLHPTRLIKFLVGQKGKGVENFAIGGPWSPSADGENPQSDPGVLVRTAIRTCKALTGIDLSACIQWYRVVEFYYWRESSSGGKGRLETVVLFLPDVWSAQPSRVDWPNIQEVYKTACEAALHKLESPEPEHAPEPAPEPDAEKSQIVNDVQDTSTITIDENEEDAKDKPAPTHYSKIDLKTFKVDQLRQELQARNASYKGVRAQLVSRLSKLLKAEEASEGKTDEVLELDESETDKKQEKEECVEIHDDSVQEETDENKKEAEKKDEKEKEVKKEKTEKEIEEEKRKLEKEKANLKYNYEIPSTTHILVHPSTTAKGGKFNCSVATLSLLLDYRVTDNKEHSFELFVFAELFNEMLQRDFGFYVYKTLYTLPEKAEEVKEVKDKSVEKSEKKEDKIEGDKKDEKKEESKDKKDDKRDERRESRRRERKESPSDDERSSSPKRRGRGVDLPTDPYLLLALVYFDTARGGNIFKKDLQNLFMSIGLKLSRSQIQSILEKVCVKDVFSYRPLVHAIKELASGSVDSLQDLPLDVSVNNTEVPPQISELESTIATGNRQLLPVFKSVNEEETEAASGETKDISDTGIVTYKSRVIDVGALVSAETRNAAQRLRLESALDAARAALRQARAAAAATQQAERGAQAQLADLAAALATAKARVASLTASSKIFHSTLKAIQTKVEAVVNIKYEDDDVVEISNGPSKVQKEDKKEKSEENAEKDNDEPVPEDKTDSSQDSKAVDSKKPKDETPAETMEIDDKE